jgi:hypothetical protein
MKTLILSSLLLTFGMNIGHACEKIADVCATEVKLTAKTQEFLKLEAKLGKDIYDLNHVNQIKVYKIANTKLFEKKYVTTERLNALSIWATKKLGVYEKPEYDATEMLQSVETKDYSSYNSFIENAFMDAGAHLENILTGDAEELTAAQKDMMKKRSSLQSTAFYEFTDLFFGDKETKVTIYDLLDNNNENVQDAQFVLIGNGHIVLMNRFWYL